MVQTQSNIEFMSERDISDSFEGLEQSRIEWEKKNWIFTFIGYFWFIWILWKCKT